MAPPKSASSSRRKARKPPRGSREAVMQRLWRAAERQAQDIENRLAETAQDPAVRERDARLLATLVKTLAELSAVEDGKTERGNDRRGAGKAAEHHDHSGDGPGVGIDEFRRELARRLAALTDEGD